MQTRHPLFDDLSKIATSAAGTLQGIGEEAKAFWQARLEAIIADMDLVRRDEYDVLLDRVAALEAALAAETEAKSGTKTTATKKKTTKN